MDLDGSLVEPAEVRHALQDELKRLLRPRDGDGGSELADIYRRFQGYDNFGHRSERLWRLLQERIRKRYAQVKAITIELDVHAGVFERSDGAIFPMLSVVLQMAEGDENRQTAHEVPAIRLLWDDETWQ